VVVQVLPDPGDLEERRKPDAAQLLLKAGAVFADGPKADVLTADRLSDLYETPVRLACVDGYFLAYPG